ncbi:Bug family tripartite tricarboxylate transporter substrate binding protein [Roseomonas marmotae]|uniref:Tripartite tricarboxylate transporter substrate binding protein n=1 Tax=Roseomonas marmotae TaxID=2768161 RepID=A0ABS3KC89_9PROT|nr:tripartite tricarboxylate transporter substrate binding protein [Roseomonas marmotae]MBO1074525.1 tripartite tricarboxylate transporter substrate binding protein [Roseomonas marmotae]QTI81559.1 tripartite tricarboxylate transporter substrate binding protein [Roseomonas marmotae]
MSSITRRGLGGLAIGAGLAAAARPARAETWPSRPATVIVPWPAGGSTDVLARGLSRYLGDRLGHPAVVDNRSGANGNIGAAMVARAAPDGYTLMVTTNAPITNNTLLYRSMPFDPNTDLTPVALLAELPIVIAARKDMPYSTVQELIAYAKKNPGKVNCGTPPLGAVAHLAVELLMYRTGIQLNVIPYRGSAPLTNDLLAGSVDMALDLVTTYLPHIETGALKALGVTATQAIPQLPDTPPVQAQGVADYQATGWISLLGPAKMPAEIVSRLNAESNAYLALEETKALLPNLGLTPLGGTAADLTRRMTAEVELWRPVIKAANISVE